MRCPICDAKLEGGLVCKYCNITKDQIEKASNKKDMLRHKFNQDFDEGIFLKNGQQFLDYNLEQISKFGGFADFEKIPSFLKKTMEKVRKM